MRIGVPPSGLTPARASAAGAITVRSAPVSSSRLSGTPLSRACTTTGPPPANGRTVPADGGGAGGAGLGAGAPTSTAPARYASGMDWGSLV